MQVVVGKLGNAKPPTHSNLIINLVKMKMLMIIIFIVMRMAMMMVEEEIGFIMLPVLESHAAPFLLEIPGLPLFRPKIGEIAVETLPRKSVKKFCATAFYSANGETCFCANKWPGEGSSQIQYQILS